MARPLILLSQHPQGHFSDLLDTINDSVEDHDACNESGESKVGFKVHVFMLNILVVTQFFEAGIVGLEASSSADIWISFIPPSPVSEFLGKIVNIEKCPPICRRSVSAFLPECVGGFLAET